MAEVVLSVGYERRSIEEFIELLVNHGVVKVVDVREKPASRKPGFSKRSLAEHLESAGIEYLHLRSAGNPFRTLKADIDHCLQLYKSHLCENPEAVEMLAAELENETVAVLCYERDHESCHRSVLLDALARHGHNLEVIRVE